MGDLSRALLDVVDRQRDLDVHGPNAHEERKLAEAERTLARAMRMAIQEQESHDHE